MGKIQLLVCLFYALQYGGCAGLQRIMLPQKDAVVVVQIFIIEGLELAKLFENFRRIFFFKLGPVFYLTKSALIQATVGNCQRNKVVIDMSRVWGEDGDPPPYGCMYLLCFFSKATLIFSATLWICPSMRVYIFLFFVIIILKNTTTIIEINGAKYYFRSLLFRRYSIIGTNECYVTLFIAL